MGCCGGGLVKSWVQYRTSMAWKMAVMYIGFSSLFWVGEWVGQSRSIVGELGDVLAMTLLIWPYLLVLSLQSWIPVTEISFFFLQLLGLGLVVVFGYNVQKHFRLRLDPGWRLWAWSIGLCPIPLLVVQGLVALVVGGLMHLPIGE